MAMGKHGIDDRSHRPRSHSKSSSQTQGANEKSFTSETIRRSLSSNSRERRNDHKHLSCSSSPERGRNHTKTQPSSVKERKRKRRSSRSSDSSSGTNSDSSESSDSSTKRKKHRKDKKRRKREKKLKKKMKKEKKKMKKLSKLKKLMPLPVIEIKSPVPVGLAVPTLKDSDGPDRLLGDRAKAMAPMTKEEWEKRQSVIRRVYDEETGRHRLIKGDGEVIEEIVSRDRHMAINRQATKGDGEYFQANSKKRAK